MPFTFSHIVYALPLKKIFKTKISTTGLVIGSMLPDVEYYLRMTMYGTWGHTWSGILWYEVPIGIILAFVFHLCIRDQLILHLPQLWSDRAAECYGFDWNQYFRKNGFTVLCSMYLGIATHVLLDIFTHSNGYIFGVGFDVLDTSFMDIAIYQWNQIILSILGLGLLYFVFYLQPKASGLPTVTVRQKLKYWFTFLLCFLVIYLIRVWVGLPSEKIVIQHMVVFCSAASIALFMTSMYSSYAASRVYSE